MKSSKMWAGVVLVSLAACGGSGNGDGADGGITEPDPQATLSADQRAFVQAYGERVCALYAECECGAAKKVACEERVADDAARFLNANEDAREAYRKDCRADLLKAVDAWVCTGAPAGDLDVLLAMHCPPEVGVDGGATGGTLGKGEACQDGFVSLGDCAPGLICDYEADTCVQLPEVGEPCKNDSCAAGAYCETVISTSTCQALLVDGEECRDGEACLTGACIDGFCGGLDPSGEGLPEEQGVCAYTGEVFGYALGCESDDACDDFDPCTQDSCSEGRCAFSEPCHGFGRCVADDEGVESCQCDPGHLDAYCATCAETHEKESDGRCTPAPDPDRFMLVTTEEESRYGLAAVDEDGVIYPLVSTDVPVSDLTINPATGQLYGLTTGHPEALVEIDLKTGALSTLDSLGSYHRVFGLAYNADDDVIYLNATIGAGSYQLEYSFEQERVTGASSGVGSVTGIAYDETAQRYLGVTESSRVQRHSWDPSMSLGPIEALPDGATDADMTFRDGTLFLAANRQLSRKEWTVAFCRAAAEALGLDTSELNGTGTYESDTEGAGLLRITSGTKGPRVWGYGSYGDRNDPPREVRVETSEPGDIVCIGTYEEQMTVTIAKDAKFELLVIGSYEPGQTVVFEDGFVYEGSLDQAVHQGVSDPETPPDPATHAELFLGYNGGAWSTASMPSPYYDGSLRKIPVIGALDWETGAYDFVEMSEPTFAGGLTALR